MHNHVVPTRRLGEGGFPENLTVEEAAAHVGFATWTVYQMVHQGKIPYRRFAVVHAVLTTALGAEGHAAEQRG